MRRVQYRATITTVSKWKLLRNNRAKKYMYLPSSQTRWRRGGEGEMKEGRGGGRGKGGREGGRGEMGGLIEGV